MIQISHKDHVAIASAGFPIWDEAVGVWVVVGARIIVASGLFIDYGDVTVRAQELFKTHR